MKIKRMKTIWLMKIINEDHIMETQLLSKGYQSQDLTFSNHKIRQKILSSKHDAMAVSPGTGAGYRKQARRGASNSSDVILAYCTAYQLCTCNRCRLPKQEPLQTSTIYSQEREDYFTEKTVVMAMWRWIIKPTLLVHKRAWNFSTPTGIINRKTVAICQPTYCERNCSISQASFANIWQVFLHPRQGITTCS